MISNVHNLTHLVDEVKNLEPCQVLVLSHLKTCIRLKICFSIDVILQHKWHGDYQNRVLCKTMQIGLQSRTFSQLQKKRDSRTTFRIQHYNTETTILLKNRTLSVELKKCCVTQRSRTQWSNTLWGSSVKEQHDLFHTPTRSFLIFFSKFTLNEAHKYGINDIFCKLVAIKENNNIIFIPLLDTLKNNY